MHSPPLPLNRVEGSLVDNHDVTSTSGNKATAVSVENMPGAGTAFVLVTRSTPISGINRSLIIKLYFCVKMAMMRWRSSFPSKRDVRESQLKQNF